jgi:hypothetical protein
MRALLIASSWLLLLAGALIGFALGDGHGAVRGFVVAFGVGMLGIAAAMLIGAIRAGYPDEDWAVVGGYVLLRGGSGVCAIWLGLGGGSSAGWSLVALVIAYPLWMTVMRRRRGTAKAPLG